MNWISARSSRAPSPMQQREAGAGDLGRALEVEDAQLDAEVPVRLGLEVERRSARPSCAARGCPLRPRPRARCSCGTLGSSRMKASSSAWVASSRCSSSAISAADLAHLRLGRLGVAAGLDDLADAARLLVALLLQPLDLAPAARAGRRPARGTRSSESLASPRLRRASATSSRCSLTKCRSSMTAPHRRRAAGLRPYRDRHILASLTMMTRLQRRSSADRASHPASSRSQSFARRGGIDFAGDAAEDLIHGQAAGSPAGSVWTDASGSAAPRTPRLPALAACLLTGEPVRLSNVPRSAGRAHDAPGAGAARRGHVVRTTDGD